MQKLADALVYAVVYVNLREDEDVLDDDVEALESIMAELQDATDAEKDALSAAANRALEAERSGDAREDVVEAYSTWMEDAFGDEGWSGNDRV